MMSGQGIRFMTTDSEVPLSSSADRSGRCLFVCLFVCAYDSRYACGGTATAETTFLGRGPEYTRVTAEETRFRIAY